VGGIANSNFLAARSGDVSSGGGVMYPRAKLLPAHSNYQDINVP